MCSNPGAGICICFRVYKELKIIYNMLETMAPRHSIFMSRRTEKKEEFYRGLAVRQCGDLA